MDGTRRTDGSPTGEEPTHQEPTISSVSDLVALLSPSHVDSRTWFRGQIDKSWLRIPSARRKSGWVDHEDDMLKQFRQQVAGRAPVNPVNDWEWICLAQHHRLPTRLLDWTSNPLIGLYFAVESDGGEEGDADGRLFCLDPYELNRKNFGSRNLLLLGMDQDLDDYLLSSNSKQTKGPVAVIAQQSFARIVAQSGVFTLSHHRDPEPLEKSLGVSLSSWIIPVTAKERIRNELDALNINRASVYLDLDSFAMLIREEYDD
ncbi:FRG domain-containing protein [Amycolatopsis marina]|uniref:FRG domain-containing protein n=1 Tax=Amycolatopsis marina TaxID=490629 RepID=A0A1I0W076_9PSEU|nr:FRG domain-containing protein [Amycolatopsis marina]